MLRPYGHSSVGSTFAQRKGVMGDSNRRYTLRDDLTSDELQRFIEELLRQLREDDKTIQAAAKSTGVSAGELKAAAGGAKPVISISQTAGIDPGTVAIVVAFAPLAVHIGKSLWDTVILPRLKDHFGGDALKSPD